MRGLTHSVLNEFGVGNNQGDPGNVAMYGTTGHDVMPDVTPTGRQHFSNIIISPNPTVENSRAQ